MKKLILIALSALLAMAMCACGGNQTESKASSAESDSQSSTKVESSEPESSKEESAASAESSESAESSKEESKSESSDNSSSQEEMPEDESRVVPTELYGTFAVNGTSGGELVYVNITSEGEFDTKNFNPESMSIESYNMETSYTDNGNGSITLAPGPDDVKITLSYELADGGKTLVLTEVNSGLSQSFARVE